MNTWRALEPAPHIRFDVELQVQRDATATRWLGSALHGAIGKALVELDGGSFETSQLYAHFLKPVGQPPGWCGAGPGPRLVVHPPAVSREGADKVLGEGERLRFSVVLIGESDTRAKERLISALHRCSLLQSVPVFVSNVRCGAESLDRESSPSPSPSLPKPPLQTTRELTFSTRSPLLLRHRGKLVHRPELEPIVRSALQRLIVVRAIAGLSTPEVRLDQLAALLTKGATRTEDDWVKFAEERFSSRQGKRHPIEGVLGDSTWLGDLAAAATVLRWAMPFGIGKGSALGLGAYTVHIEP